MEIPTIVNTDQAAAWNGPEGQHWAAHTAHAPTDIDRAILDAAAIEATDRILDVGCGTGQTTRGAARRAADGRALGVDLSGPQLARARELAAEEGLTNVAFEQGDAQVHPLAPAGFDVAISSFGVMFFADAAAAFANIGRALRAGGRLAFVVPRAAAEQPWFTEPLAGLVDEQPDLPPADDAPGMFSLADPARIVAVLDGAGFVDIRPDPLAAPMDFGPLDEAVAFYLGSGPVRAVLEQRPDLAASARTRLEATLSRYLTPAGVHIPATSWLVTASRP